MTETKRIYYETEKQVYDQRRDEIERYGYEVAFGIDEKCEWNENNMLRGEF